MDFEEFINLLIEEAGRHGLKTSWIESLRLWDHTRLFEVTLSLPDPAVVACHLNLEWGPNIPTYFELVEGQHSDPEKLRDAGLEPWASASVQIRFRTPDQLPNHIIESLAQHAEEIRMEVSPENGFVGVEVTAYPRPTLRKLWVEWEWDIDLESDVEQEIAEAMAALHRAMLRFNDTAKAYLPLPTDDAPEGSGDDRFV